MAPGRLNKQSPSDCRRRGALESNCLRQKQATSEPSARQSAILPRGAAVVENSPPERGLVRQKAPSSVRAVAQRRRRRCQDTRSAQPTASPHDPALLPQKKLRGLENVGVGRADVCADRTPQRAVCTDRQADPRTRRTACQAVPAGRLRACQLVINIIFDRLAACRPRQAGCLSSHLEQREITVLSGLQPYPAATAILSWT